MKTARTFALLLSACLAMGCAPSLNPLSSKETAVRDPAIEGVWFRDDLKYDFDRRESLSIQMIRDDSSTPGDNSFAYTIALETKQASNTFVANLVELGGRRFLDLCSSEYPLNPHVLPVHHIFRITLSDNQLLVAPLDANKLEQTINAKEPAFPVARVDRRLVLTGSTAELQAFFAKYDQEVFAKDRPFRKARPATK